LAWTFTAFKFFFGGIKIWYFIFNTN
jgi:hypothetical protein